MYGIEKEASIFLCACLSGGVVVFAYEIIKVFRRLVRHNILMINFEDFFYWIGVSIYLFYQMYVTTYGIIRWYFILGVVVGVFCVKFGLFRIAGVGRKIQKRLEKRDETK